MKSKMDFKNKLISIIIVTYNRPKALSALLTSVFASSYKDIEIIVVNNSDISFKEDYNKLFQRYKGIKHYWNQENLLLAGAWNKGFEISKGSLVLFCGDDYIFDKDMLQYLVESLLKRANIGVVGPMLYYSNGQPLIPAYALSLSTGVPLLKKYKAGNNEVELIDCILLTKRELVEKVGGFDEKHFKFYLESADFCTRVRRLGFRCLVRYEAKSIHDHMPLKAYILPEPDRYKNPLTYYYLMSCKIKYIRKYANLLQKIIFFTIFLPLLCIWHSSTIIIRGKEKPFFKFHCFYKGVINGLLEKL